MKYASLFAAVAASLSALAAEHARPPELQTGPAALQVMAENVYGVRPSFKDFKPTAKVIKTEDVTFGAVEAVRRIVRLNTMTPLGETNFNAVAYFPKRAVATEKRNAAFIYLSFHSSMKTDDTDWPLELILGRGVATVGVNYQDVLRDDAHVFDGIKRPANGWGAISTWAFAAGRVAEWLMERPEIDGRQIAVVGHSRLGKTAAWAAATNPRFAYACVNDSGCLGARLSCRNLFGETIEQITKAFPHWFAPNCRDLWAGKDYELPFDQHWVLGSIAPRLLHVASADGDWWACPSGEFAGFECARYAWKGKAADRVRYHIRHGGHAIMAEDWIQYLDFAAECGW